MDVGHFGAAHALGDPAPHVAEDALRVIVEFHRALDGLAAPQAMGEIRSIWGVEPEFIKGASESIIPDNFMSKIGLQVPSVVRKRLLIQ